MFRIGDKVVCVNNFQSDHCIIAGKIYTIIGLDTMFLNIGIGSYYRHRFISLQEYRKQKLNKICLEKVIE